MQHALSQLICLNGCLTNPNNPGVEKMVVAVMKSSWRESAPVDVSGMKLGEMDVEPLTFFCVKGWNRAVCTLAVLMAAFESPSMLEADPISSEVYPI